MTDLEKKARNKAGREIKHLIKKKIDRIMRIYSIDSPEWMLLCKVKDSISQMRYTADKRKGGFGRV